MLAVKLENVASSGEGYGRFELEPTTGVAAQFPLHRAAEQIARFQVPVRQIAAPVATASRPRTDQYRKSEVGRFAPSRARWSTGGAGYPLLFKTVGVVARRIEPPTRQSRFREQYFATRTSTYRNRLARFVRIRVSKHLITRLLERDRVLCNRPRAAIAQCPPPPCERTASSPEHDGLQLTRCPKPFRFCAEKLPHAEPFKWVT